MTTDLVTKKKLDRWIPRLKDRDSDVRQEALNVIVDILNGQPQLLGMCMSHVVEYVHMMIRTKAGGLYFCLDTLESLEGNLLATSDDLLAAIFECPTNDETVTAQLMRLLWQQVSEGHLQPSSPSVAPLLVLAKKIADLPHGGGRRDALRIMDWVEDNL